MQERPRRRDSRQTSTPQLSTARRVFGSMAEAGAAAYVRSRDLPKLIALWPHELDDHSPEGCRHILAKLRRALRAERRRALSGHWSYDLNRHLGLISAYKGELAGSRRLEAQPNCTRRGKRTLRLKAGIAEDGVRSVARLALGGAGHVVTEDAIDPAAILRQR